MSEAEGILEVRESNNYHWVNRHLKVGWEVLGLFPADENRVLYVICWTNNEKAPVEPIFPYPNRTTPSDMSGLQYVSDGILRSELLNS